jgi:phage tail sheath protein FI
VADFSFPGVFVEEIPFGSRPIEGVSLGTAAFAGVTERGPERPVRVQSWAEYEHSFGGSLPGTVSYLPDAVRGFFDNGGRHLYIVRVLGSGARFTNGRFDELTIKPVGRGAWGNRIFVRIIRSTEPGNEQDDGPFQLTVLYYRTVPPLPLVDPLSEAPLDREHLSRREPDSVERFEGVSARPDASNFVEGIVNTSSQLIRVLVETASVPHRDGTAGFVPLGDDGSDGDGADAPAYAAALAELEPLEEVALVAAPDEVRFTAGNTAGPVTDAIVHHCEQSRRFALVSAPAGQRDVARVRPPIDTRYGAFYYPWIEVADPAGGGAIQIPPTGHVAGVYARMEYAGGVHKPPVDELEGVTGLEIVVSDAIQQVLNPRGVNCIRDFRVAGRGIRVSGARTMSSDPEWKYIPVRRLLLFLELSIERGLSWVTFEPNAEPIWTRTQTAIENFLMSVWRGGALEGMKPEEAFFVKIDRTTMTQDDIDNGRLVALIGVAPARPAEFVIFRVGMWTADHRSGD